MNIEKNRLGIIKVSSEFIQCGYLPEALYKTGISPIQTSRDIYHDILVYKCISNAFEIVKDGEKIPEYNIEIEKTEDNKKTYNVIKCIS